MEGSIRIDVDNKIAIYHFSNSEQKELVSFILTREMEGAKYSKKAKIRKWDGKIHFFNTLNNTSSPNVVDYVKRILEKHGLKVVVNDYRWKFPLKEENVPSLVIKDKNGKIINITYKDYQLDTIIKLANNGGGLVNIATNGGKSIIFTGFIKALVNEAAFKSLIIVHKKELFKQTYELMSLNFGKENVGQVTSSETDIKDKVVVIAMIQSLVNRLTPKKKTLTKKDKLLLTPEECTEKLIHYKKSYEIALKTKDKLTEFLKSIQVVIVDEAHHAIAKSYKTLMRYVKAAPIKAGFSGTIHKVATLEGLTLVSMFGEVVVSIRNKYLIEKNVSLIPRIFIYKLPSLNLDLLMAKAKYEYVNKRKEEGFSDEEVFKGVGTYVFQRVYEEGVIYNDIQNAVILELCKYFISRNLQTLIVVNRRETHGVALSDLLQKNNVDHVLWTGVTVNREEVLNTFKNKQTPVMLATSVVDEGLNIHSIDAIILAAGMKSHIQLLQRLGRGLRKGSSNDYLVVVDFYHKGNHILETHSNDRLNVWLQEDLEILPVTSIKEIEYYVDKFIIKGGAQDVSKN